MRHLLVQTLLLSVVVASISYTITETKVFEPFRKWLKRKSEPAGKLFSCGYCVGHWFAFVLAVGFQLKLFSIFWVLDYFFTGLVIAWLSGFQWILMCLLMDKAGK